MPRGLQQKGIVRRNKLLHAAIKLFLQNGYEKTTTAAIAKEAQVSYSSLFAAFENKEALLLDLVKVMFQNQFSSAEKQDGTINDPVFLYCVETAVQIYITELSEPLRELYVMAYSLPSTSEYIYEATAKRLEVIFAKTMQQAQPKDFYEMEVASAGVMRAFMAKPCDLYFTVERKISRFLQCSLTLYGVPKPQQQMLIDMVLKMDLTATAQAIINGMIQKAEAGIDILEEG